jgi:hypothetical protein
MEIPVRRHGGGRCRSVLRRGDIASGFAVWRPVTDDPDSVFSFGVPYLKLAAVGAGLRLRS